MPLNKETDVFVFFCHNCTCGGGGLPRQWSQDGVHVQLREVPCSGKIDAQYLFNTLEGGSQGICVVACPKGECTLAQGNYRAHVRVNTVQRLLGEIGLEPDRAQILECGQEDATEKLAPMVKEVVGKFAAMGPSAIAAHVTAI